MPITNKSYPFNDDTVKKVPSKAGAYELLYKGTVVYIGSSGTSVRQRLSSHRKRKTFAKVTDFRYKKVEWANDALALETKLCEAFRKKNNRKPPRLQERTPKNKSWFDW